MVCAFIYLEMGIASILVNSSHARNVAGIKVPRKQKAKEVVLTYIKECGIFPEDKWEYKKTGKIKDYCYDMADSFVVAFAGFKGV